MKNYFFTASDVRNLMNINYNYKEIKKAIYKEAKRGYSYISSNDDQYHFLLQNLDDNSEVIDMLREEGFEVTIDTTRIGEYYTNTSYHTHAEIKISW